MDVAGKVKAYMAEYSKSIDPQTGKVKDAGLQHYAEIGTFQEDPGIGINSLSMFLENMPFVGPLGKLVVPFLRTPANIIRYQVQHTPMVGRYAGEYLAVKQSGDVLRMAEYEGREMIGAMTIAVGAGLAASELITGNMPADPRERNRWKTLDIRPRSIKIGDRWVSYNTIEPLSNILAASADIVMLAKTGLNEDWVENLVGQLGLFASLNTLLAGAFGEGGIDVEQQLSLPRVMSFAFGVSIFNVIVGTALAALYAMIFNVIGKITGGIAVSFTNN
jgi:hypothetical protein